MFLPPSLPAYSHSILPQFFRWDKEGRKVQCEGRFRARVQGRGVQVSCLFGEGLLVSRPVQPTQLLLPHQRGMVCELGPQLSGGVRLPAGVRNLEGLQGQQRLVDTVDCRIGSEIHLVPFSICHLRH